jgi:hypothetical protein
MGSLDCHTLNSTLSSLAKLFSTDEGELRGALTGFSFPAFVAILANAREHPETVLWNRIVGTGTRTPIPATTFWFHATRVMPGTDFRQGIQPLMEWLPHIRDSLDKISARIGRSARPNSAVVGRRQGGRAYTLKTSDPIHWGPYAFLVRDAILRPADVTHDYLETPEIVEDIANGNQFLINEYRRISRACIVKFRSVDPRPDVVKVALYYSYFSLWEEPMNLDTNTHFDGKGRPVPFDDIVGMEYPEPGSTPRTWRLEEDKG